MRFVTPYVGVWIETITDNNQEIKANTSLLMWECGLKQKYLGYYEDWRNVTPYVGVWIETWAASCLGTGVTVTPYVGVWIETLRGWRYL